MANEEFSSGPLTEAECKELRRILRDEARMAWFWATLRVWGGWAVTVAGGLYAAWEFVFKHVRFTP